MEPVVISQKFQQAGAWDAVKWALSEEPLERAGNPRAQIALFPPPFLLLHGKLSGLVRTLIPAAMGGACAGLMHIRAGTRIGDPIQ